VLGEQRSELLRKKDYKRLRDMTGVKGNFPLHVPSIWYNVLHQFVTVSLNIKKCVRNRGDEERLTHFFILRLDKGIYV
jgi:hypothetical protein